MGSECECMNCIPVGRIFNKTKRIKRSAKVKILNCRFERSFFAQGELDFAIFYATIKMSLLDKDVRIRMCKKEVYMYTCVHECKKFYNWTPIQTGIKLFRINLVVSKLKGYVVYMYCISIFMLLKNSGNWWKESLITGKSTAKGKLILQLRVPVQRKFTGFVLKSNCKCTSGKYRFEYMR